MANKFNLYAYAHARDVKVIQLFSIADWRNEISEKKAGDSGLIRTLAASFTGMNAGDKRSPFSFVWKPDKYVPVSLFSSLKYGEDFTLELRVRIVDENKNIKFRTNWNFYQCQYQKSRRKSGGMHKVEASYGLFRPTELEAV